MFFRFLKQICFDQGWEASSVRWLYLVFFFFSFSQGKAGALYYCGVLMVQRKQTKTCDQ